MEVLGLQIFVSLMLVLGSLLLFAWSAKQRDHEHSDRLALLPLEKDSSRPSNESEARSARARRAEVADNGF